MSKKRKRHPSFPPPATQSQPRVTSEQQVHAFINRIEPDFFPAAFEYVFGPIAIPPTTSQWPNNIAFYCTDWTKDQPEGSFLKRENEEGWDVILACVLGGCAKGSERLKPVHCLDFQSRNGSIFMAGMTGC